MPADKITLAVIMLSWNDSTNTGIAIDRLLPQLPANSAIWVVDNGSEIPFSNEHPAVKIIFSPDNLGFAGGNNLGIRAALEQHPQYILLLNTDAWFEDMGLDKLVADMSVNKDVHISGPLIEEEGVSYFGGRDPGLFLNTRLRSFPEAREKNYYLPGTALILRNEVFHATGLLDEEYFFSGEVADLCARAATAGMNIELNPRVRIVHNTSHQQSSLRETLYLYYNIRNRFLFIRKHHESKQSILFVRWTYNGFRLMTGALLRGNYKKARAVFWALHDGLFAIFGNRNDRFI
jgi:GT2 family glycosyltransferase